MLAFSKKNIINKNYRVACLTFLEGKMSSDPTWLIFFLGRCKWRGRNDYQSNYAGNYLTFLYVLERKKYFFKTQDEVDKSVYAKMADDLERAATKLKKRKVKKVKESPAELTA